MKVSIENLFALALIMLLSTGVEGFQSSHLTKFYIKQKSMTCRISISDTLSKEPSTPNGRLQLIVSGDSVSTALFRSDINKEAVFRRGCALKFTEKNSKKVELTIEGKSKQIMRFIPWLLVLASELNSPQRKPNFQGPTIKISIDDAKWLSYVGDLKGFVSDKEAPVLGDTVLSNTPGTMEAKSMTGTDESV